jgi:hypothetical protein
MRTRAIDAWTQEGKIIVELDDGQCLCIPVEISPRLYGASDELLDRVRVENDGTTLQWDDLGEHLDIRYYLPGWRCLECGYLLDGLPEPRCPECGRPFDPGDRGTFITWQWSGIPLFVAALVFTAALAAAAYAIGPPDSRPRQLSEMGALVVVSMFFAVGQATVLVACIATFRRPRAEVSHRGFVLVAAGISGPALLGYLIWFVLT